MQKTKKTQFQQISQESHHVGVLSFVYLFFMMSMAFLYVGLIVYLGILPGNESYAATPSSFSIGGDHSCAVFSDSTVYCWGYNNIGQIGNGSTGGAVSTPIAVTGITNAVKVATGNYHSCAVLSTGAVKCWGYNNYGQLGDGSTTSSTVPVSVSGISTATNVTAGTYFTCALLSDGNVQCWGNNVFGQLGSGNTTNSSVPVMVVGTGGTTAITTGAGHTCALLSTGAIKCWGLNSSGQLGDGTTTNSTAPAPLSGVVGISTAIGISANTGAASGGIHTCAVLADGSVKCWGANAFGQLGDGTTTTRTSPVSVSGISTATNVGIGDRHSCARLSSGALQCWGANEYGQLGNGLTSNSSTPVSVTGITTATLVDGGGYDNDVTGEGFTCALLADNTGRCWGSNRVGQLGNGNTTSSSLAVAVSFPVPNTAPVVGYTADNVIPTAQVVQATDGTGVMTVSFRLKDAETNSIILNTFQYSVDGGTTWSAPTNGDVSNSLYKTTAGADDWKTNGATGSFTSATGYTGTVHSFYWNTKHADVTGVGSVDQSDVRVRFTANDGTVNSSSAGTSENFRVDDAAPSGGSVSDGSSTDVDYQTSTTTMSANWSGFTDGSGTISSYQWAIGTTSGGEQALAYTASGVSGTTATNSTLTLASGTTYYISAKAIDSFGNTSSAATSDGIMPDSSAPTAGSVNDGTSTDVDSQTSTATIAANWSGFSDAQSGVTGYEWAIGTISGGTSVQSYTSVGTSTSGSNSNLNLVYGTTYYVTVRATNGALATVTVTSDGVLVPQPGRSSFSVPSSDTSTTENTVSNTPDASADNASRETSPSPVPVQGEPVSQREQETAPQEVEQKKLAELPKEDTTQQPTSPEAQTQTVAITPIQSKSSDGKTLLKVEKELDVVVGKEMVRDVSERIIIDRLQKEFTPAPSAKMLRRVGVASVVILTGTDANNSRTVEGGAKNRGTLSSAVSVQIFVDETLVKRLGLRTESLALFFYNKDKKLWEEVVATYNADTKQFETNVRELGVYAVGQLKK